jgi:polyhydroxyalkanoate synthase subunit PhaC
VNPPGPKSWYETAEANPPDPADWRKIARRHGGSWWEDWAVWAKARAGDLVDLPPMGSGRYPALGEAPGDYIRG